MATAAIIATIFILAFGLLCFKRPGKALEIQRRFYEKINWKIEPIVVQKELKNTRAMGFFMVMVGSATLILVLLKILILPK